MHVLHADNEWRFDPVDDRWALVTQNRRTLPPLVVAQSVAERDVHKSDACVFCTTPPAGPLTRLVDDHDRQVLAYPSPTPLCFVEHGPPPHTPFGKSGALGAHELLVPEGAKHHDAGLDDMDPGTLALLFALALRRLHELSGDRRLESARVAFLPHAHARLAHVHATLLAVPHAYAPRDPCPVCADLEHARGSGRVVLDDEGVLAWTPFAPRGDLHVRIAVAGHGMALSGEPARHASAELARHIRALGAAMTRLAPGAALAATSGPMPLQTHDGHLFVDVEVPLQSDALLGRSLGASVVTVAPEEVAGRLRAALGDV